MLGRRLVRFATEDASPTGLVVEVAEVGTDAWPSVATYLLRLRTLLATWGLGFLLVFGLAVGVVRWRFPPSCFLLLFVFWVSMVILGLLANSLYRLPAVSFGSSS